MKNLIYLTISTVLITYSCTVDKRMYSSGYNIQWKNSGGQKSKEELLTENTEIRIPKSTFENVTKKTEHKIIDSKSIQKLANNKLIKEIKKESENRNLDNNIQYKVSSKKDNKKIIPLFKKSKLDDNKCDEILLKNGDEISAKIVEITPSGIKYKRCDNLDGPLITIEKNKIFSITYSNGSKEIISKVENKTNDEENENDKKQKGFAIASLVTGILGIPILAIVFGLIQIYLIKDNPKKYGGKGMAIAGYALGVFWLLLILALLTVA